METFYLENFFIGDESAKQLVSWFKLTIASKIDCDEPLSFAVDAVDEADALATFLAFLSEQITNTPRTTHRVIHEDDGATLYIERLPEVAVA